MDPIEWLEHLRELLTAVPDEDSVSLHKGRKGLKLALSKLKKSAGRSDLKAVVKALTAFHDSPLSGGFDPDDGEARDETIRLVRAIIEPASLWLAGNGTDRRAPMVRQAQVAAQDVLDACLRLEIEGVDYSLPDDDSSERSLDEVDEVDDGVDLEDDPRVRAARAFEATELPKVAPLLRRVTELLDDDAPEVEALVAAEGAVDELLDRIGPVCDGLELALAG